MSDLNFEQLLAEHNKDYKEAKEFSDWMPPDGDYTVVIKGCDKGVSTKGDTPLLWWKHTAEILAGEDPGLMGREFTSLFASSRSYGSAKSQAKVITGGVSAPDDASGLDAVLMGATGAVLQVQIKTRTSTKNGNDYTNCFYQELVDTSAVEEAEEAGMPEEPPQGTPVDENGDPA